MARDYNRLDEPKVPSSSLLYFFREAVRRIWTSKRSSFVAISMIAISLLIVGLFMLVAENLEYAVTQWQGRSRVNVYFEPDATPARIAAVRAHLSSRPELARHQFVTREEALRRFRSTFANVSELVDQLEENPFPPSFEIDVRPQFIESQAFRREMAAVRALPAVEHVQFDWDWLARLRRLAAIINLAGIAAGGILAVAAAFTIANVIRLTMMLYREEIEIMRLVGATENIIRGPFLVEGIMQGMVGGVVAVGLLFGLFTLARETLDLSRSFLFGFLVGTFLPWQKIAILIAGGAVAGWFGSWLSVRESKA
ncbi:MAG TPA: permease-like cell division protein FtsX [Thermoanaerobaculia bacterium]|nr:permease-like cell division protein FtsX [Thermoanaerobaculia bacterium]